MYPRPNIKKASPDHRINGVRERDEGFRSTRFSRARAHDDAKAMSPPDARAGARLRVATMFTGAGAIDYGCVARDARRRDGATARETRTERRTNARATTTDSTRDKERRRRATTRDRDEETEDGARRREGARDGTAGGRTRD